MKYLLVEDEKIAANRLKSMISAVRPDYECIGTASTIRESVDLLQARPGPDLLFLDIQLADGLSFEIFEAMEVASPVIFTTAYDQYAIRAFKFNSVDYLLKPIDRDELKGAIDKLEQGFQNAAPPAIDRLALENLINTFRNQQFKERFVVKIGEHLNAIRVEEVSMFYSENKGTYLQTIDGRRFIVDFSLDKVEDLVDPSKFFRISRKFLVRFKAITDIIQFSNSRLKLVVEHYDTEPVIVARERVQEFKAWLDQ